ncbi:MAG: hypothetical protein M3M94_02630, partial [Actinomycetota bacterium]|nr:hypothetical protein [Actinomycetota bacterium]
PKRTGTFPVVCTELCGAGHAIMRARAVVMSQADFTAWVDKERKAAGAAQDDEVGGLAVFQAQGCDACHAFSAARATGRGGPDLDKLPQQAKRAGRPLEPFVEQSIVSPSAYIEPGYQDIMPHDYEQKIPPDQLRSLVQFLVKGSKGDDGAK